MAVRSTAISVGTTATALDLADDSGDSQSGESTLVYNDGAATVYLGGPAVTTSGATKGIPVTAGAYGPGLDLNSGDRLYGIVASGTVSVLVFEVGV